MTLRAIALAALGGLLGLAALAGCTDDTPPTGPTVPTSTETPEQIRAGAVRAAREAARDLTGLRFTTDGAGRFAQCTDDGDFILYSITIRLLQTAATVPAPRTPAITAALARSGWTRDPTRGSSAGSDTAVVLTRSTSGLRIREYGDDPAIILMELTSDCVDAGDRNSTYVSRGGELLRLT